VNTVPFNYVAELQQGAEDRRELICHMPEIWVDATILNKDMHHAEWKQEANTVSIYL
jgi:hypothetical protein